MIPGHLLIERHHCVAALISQVWHGQTAPDDSNDDLAQFGVSVFKVTTVYRAPGDGQMTEL